MLACTELLRRTQAAAFACRRVRALVGGRGAAASLDPRELVRLAAALREAETAVGDPALAGVDVVAAEGPWVRALGVETRDAGSAALVRAMEALSQARARGRVM